MSLIETAIFADYLGVADSDALQPALDEAQALAAEALGADTLELTSRIEVLLPTVGRKVLDTQWGPVTALTSLTGLSGLILASRTQFTHWAVANLDGFTADDEVTALYITGWDAETLPPSMRQALLSLSKWVMEGSQTLAAEKIGDWAATYVTGDSTPSGLPRSFMILVRRLKRP